MLNTNPGNPHLSLLPLSALRPFCIFFSGECRLAVFGVFSSSCWNFAAKFLGVEKDPTAQARPGSGPQVGLGFKTARFRPEGERSESWAWLLRAHSLTCGGNPKSRVEHADLGPGRAESSRLGLLVSWVPLAGDYRRK